MGTTAITSFPRTSVVDEILDGILEGWSGLRHYIIGRRNGLPSDPVMESLLAELLRLKLDESANIQEVMEYIQK